MGDIANAAMALPNLVALVALSGIVFALARGQKTAGPDFAIPVPNNHLKR
jgi:AGCS family alanine or glycine:cation symporter